MKKFAPIIVLTLICLVSAALLAGVNMIAAPEIEKANAEKVAASLKVVMPDGEFGTESDPIAEGAPETVREVYTDKKGGGHVVVLVTNKGYTGKEIGITVGISTSGEIIKSVITKNEESIVPSDMKPLGTYGDAYSGATADNVVDVVTGATVKYTESAIKAALYDAFVYLGYAEGSVDTNPGEEEQAPITAPRSEEEIFSLAEDFIADAEGIEEVSLYSAPRTLLKLYKEKGGKGYVAYIVVPGDYVPVATEGLVHVDNNGDIKKVQLLSWIVGHDVGYGSFESNFIGADKWHVDDVELVTGATGTSMDFRDAVSDAVATVTGLVERSNNKLIELAEELVPNSRGFELMELPENKPSTLVKLFREKGEKGYVAYIVVPGEYVAVATESLVHFNRYGEIEKVKILTWTVGHGVGYGDFEKNFEGVTEKDGADSVQLVTAATGTSKDMRNAIFAAFPFIPKHFPVPQVTGLAILALGLVATVLAVIIFKRRRRVR